MNRACIDIFVVAICSSSFETLCLQRRQNRRRRVDPPRCQGERFGRLGAKSRLARQVLAYHSSRELPPVCSGAHVSPFRRSISGEMEAFTEEQGLFLGRDLQNQMLRSAVPRMAPLFQHSNTQSTRAASSGDLSDSTILLPQATSSNLWCKISNSSNHIGCLRSRSVVMKLSEPKIS
ncbi:hypothetical protein SADUNF_Sadunf07G0005300 [Salix dunnii]|uniref:Uncharacterized protein n=1 Tax=Salix dunnii TaxID=1413687 RepID=A0A835JZB8_9ROSI|nr:hypothetical protein SADUNF_Sadunf07G0005300 [Salix dunnii]